MVSGGRLYLDSPKTGRTITFKIGEGDWGCDVGLASALRLLRQARPTTLREMSGGWGHYRLPLRIFVDTLLARQAIWAGPPSVVNSAGAVTPPAAVGPNGGVSQRKRAASPEQAATA